MGGQGDDRSAGWQWRDYWRAGAVGVGTEAPASAGPQGDTTSLWRNWFAGLEDGSRILDLATGGGAVLRHAASHATAAGKRFGLTGVDEAQLPDDAGLQALGILRLGETRAEALPFAHESFDAVTSQFGIEYADHELALDGVARVLRPGGVARMLIHHKDSEITRAALVRIRAFDTVTGDGRIVRLCREAFAARLAWPADGKVEETARELRAAILALAARVGPDPALATTRYLVSYLNDLAVGVDRYSPMSALECLHDFTEANAAWRERQARQVSAAMDRASLDAFIDSASRSGLDANTTVAWRDAAGGLLGWLVDFERRSDVAIWA
jgi:SAM-dependent methyltransferase